jgi:Mg-chelatase subunit ChlD
MNYIEFTDENINKKSLKKSSPIHYIFVVDESGSMKNSINANAHDIIIAMLLGAKPETIK